MSNNGKRPLDGLRVIDMTGEFGALCGRLLGDFGADVILVEPPEGSAGRSLPPFAPSGDSLWFAYRNSNKRGVVLDPAGAADRERLLGLIATADVVIESAKPGSAPAGLSGAELSARFPQAVVCSITAFGQTGPYSTYEATDDVVFAMSGWLTTSGVPQKPPLLMPGSLASDSASVIGVFAILTALVQKRHSGHGQYLDVAALQALSQLNTWGIPNSSAIMAAGMAPNTVRSGNAAIYPHLPTKDGFVRLVILAPRQWMAMWEWMGKPEAFADPMWATTAGRMQNLDILNPMFEEHFSTMTMEFCAAEAQRRGVVATPMLKPADVLKNEHFVSRKTFAEVEVLPGVAAKVPDGFFSLDGERQGFRFRAPTLGEHQSVLDGIAAAPPPPSAVAAAAPAPPLAGLRVLDFGHGGVGVEGGRMLVEYGADVIKIETRTYPDFMRLIMGTEMTPSFASSSRSKRSFGVNAKTAKGLELVRRLAAISDIVIENNSTGTMDDMGVGFKALQEVNPKLSMASSQLVGSSGAYASWIGYGPTTTTFGGLSHLWAFDDGDPPPGNNAIHPDHFVGRLCAIVGLLGVLSRDNTGHGVHSDIAQVEATISNIGDLLAKESVAPGSVRPEGNDDERGAPWGVFRCEGNEQWAVICVRSDRDWAELVKAMGSPAAALDGRFATNGGRLAHRDEVNAIVSAWTANHSPRGVMTHLQARGIAAGAMLSAADQITDAHLNARSFIVPVAQQQAGNLKFEGPAFAATGMSPPRITQAPLLGEHTREIARELLGLSDAEIDELIAEGVLEVPK